MMTKLFASFLFVLALPAVLEAKQCEGLHNNERIDCYPDQDSNEQACLKRGCCWQTPEALGDVNVPYCFFPKDFPSYSISAGPQTNASTTAAILTRTQPSGRPEDIQKLRLVVRYESATRLRLRFEDAEKGRWEPPIPLGSGLSVSASQTHFNVTFRQQPFGMIVKRKSDGRTLFDTASVSAPLIFANQFLQISSRLQTTRVYGIGEQRGNFTHNLSQGWKRYTLWTFDQNPQPGTDLYGVHNFMLSLFDDGSAYGIYLLNSNAQEVLFQPLPAVTYRTIGGILDFFIFSGPSPMDVIGQYYNLIGMPMMPPYWSLGFHLSRYGFHTLADINRTLTRNLAANIPLDVMWNDIDYMDKFKDWTTDPQRYKDLPQFVNDLHAKGMRYVIIVDPGISNSARNYPLYDDGLKNHVFIMKADGSGPIIGKVWPGTTAFPDFTAPQTLEWWYKAANDFHKTIAFDGLWIDMNEPSNFVPGSIHGCPAGNPLDYPPYTPWVRGHLLHQKTICPSSIQNLSTHYNLHNMYGYYEAKTTNAALQKIFPNKRVFILSRSTFSGSGRYTFHWTGDNRATWGDLHASIIQVLNFNLYAIPMVGADICGFGGNTNEELCIRWTQVGAFYPFMRNHDSLHSKDQDPASFSSFAQMAMRSVIQLRYSLLPYMYTQHFESSLVGRPLVRPLFAEFPTDTITHDIDRQFMFGPALLVSPVLQSGATEVMAYLPDARWCEVQRGVALSARKKYSVLRAPLDRINVHIRGGHIVLTKPPAANTAAQKSLPYGLRACLDDSGRADGFLFTDDGETVLKANRFNFLEFHISEKSLTTIPSVKNGEDASLDSLWVSGVTGDAAPSNVTVNGVNVKFRFDAQHRILSVIGIKVDLLHPLNISWK